MDGIIEQPPLTQDKGAGVTTQPVLRQVTADQALMATALLPLWCRAQEALQPLPLFMDQAATDLTRSLAVDFSAIPGAWRIQTCVAVRTRLLDDQIAGFIQQHPNAVIVNLGAGFDGRYFRVDNGSLLWYDLDFPQLIASKQACIPVTGRYRMVGRSILDFTWLDAIDSQGRPVLIVAEGLFMYFHESELQALFRRLAGKFVGAHLLIELLAPGAVGLNPLIDRDHAEFKWTLLHARDMEALHPKIRFLREWCVLDHYRDRWQWLGFLSEHSWVRNYFGERIVHLQLR